MFSDEAATVWLQSSQNPRKGDPLNRMFSKAIKLFSICLGMLLPTQNQTTIHRAIAIPYTVSSPYTSIV
jgi:hypothetical protein